MSTRKPLFYKGFWAVKPQRLLWSTVLRMADEFSQSSLAGARFHKVDLSGATFEQVSLAGARFDDADFSGVKIRGALLRDVDVGGEVKGRDLEALIRA